MWLFCFQILTTAEEQIISNITLESEKHIKEIHKIKLVQRSTKRKVTSQTETDDPVSNPVICYNFQAGREECKSMIWAWLYKKQQRRRF